MVKVVCIAINPIMSKSNKWVMSKNIFPIHPFIPIYNSAKSVKLVDIIFEKLEERRGTLVS